MSAFSILKAPHNSAQTPGHGPTGSVLPNGSFLPYRDIAVARAVEGAKRALDQNCDFVICQGIEAGGHVQSSMPLWELLPAVVAEARSVPVAAAGGLGDRADVIEVTSLGASAAMLGTRFIASAESGAHHAYKAALVASASSDTVLTGCFDGEWPYALHRVLRNATLASWEAAGCPPSGNRPGEGEVVARQ